MKVNFNYLVFIGCGLSLLMIILEIGHTSIFYRSLVNNKQYFKNMHIQELINQEPKFVSSQKQAAGKKMGKLGNELLTWIILTLCFCGFINQKIKKTMLKFCDNKINILGINKLGVNRLEINYICIFLTIILYSAYGSTFVKMMGKEFDTIISEIIFYLLLFLIIMPFIMALIYNLFKIFGSQLIVAFYLTFFIKATAEFFSQENADMNEFQKVDVSVYSSKVQEYLKERSLQDKVYQEKAKSDSINAALVGWGSYEHIEIYGNHGSFSDEEFESVLMHEIGHSQDYSLHKKVLALYIIKVIEFIVVMWLWRSVSKLYADEQISSISSFILILVIYEMYLGKYLMVFHKLTSQNAEINADLIAKKHGFAINLGKVLFKITVDSIEPISYTWIYNAFKSFHPTIVNRVQYLYS